MTDAQTAQVDQERITKIQKRLEHFKSQEYDRRGVQVIVDAYKADVAYLLALASLAARLQQPAKTACDDCLADRRRLAAALMTMLDSAHPSEKEHPKMFAAWQVGRQAVQHYEHAGGSLNGPSRLGASPNTDTGGESVLVPLAPLPHAAAQEAIGPLSHGSERDAVMQAHDDHVAANEHAIERKVETLLGRLHMNTSCDEDGEFEWFEPQEVREWIHVILRELSAPLSPAAPQEDQGAFMQTGPNVPFVDTPVKASVRRAFDNPTIANLHALVDAAKAEALTSRPSAAPPPAQELDVNLWIHEAVEAKLREKLKATEASRDALQGELDKAKDFRTHTEEWYAVRLQWLEDWFRGPGKDLPIADQFWHILANGTPGLHTPPTYQQQLNIAKHRAEAAEARVETLKGELAQCYRLTGADPDGNEDARLASVAVEEVRRLRSDHDALENTAALLAKTVNDQARRLVVAQSEHQQLIEQIRQMKFEHLFKPSV